MREIASENSHWFYWLDAKNICDVQGLYKKHEIKFRRICFWVKGTANPTPQVAFSRIHEPVVYGTLGKPYLNDNEKKVHEILNQGITTGNKVFEEIGEMFDLWFVKRDPTKEYIHATQKPITLCEKPLKRCTAPGHIVFSGFAGSGSDLIACEQLNRVWRGVELDEAYASVILDRWEKFTGQKAVKLN